MARLLIGTSGYVYSHWRGLFYPRGLPVREWLAYYAGHFDTLELNNSFYRLPTAATFRAWHQATPPGFLFAVKASRFLTHLKRLKDAGPPLRLFLRRARALDAGLGPVLFQLPTHFHLNLDRLERFVAALGRQRIAPGIRAVLEVRHASWLAPEPLAVLEKAGIALCLHDWRELPVRGPLTAPFVYVRRHGTSKRYGGSYTEAMLRADARNVRRWLSEGRDVYVYYNNDGGGWAVRNARRLAALLRRR
jgi:uncharacterized protein YecE (DUF72 family)